MNIREQQKKQYKEEVLRLKKKGLFRREIALSMGYKDSGYTLKRIRKIINSG